jgi:arylsulfatase A-like enzyme
MTPTKFLLLALLAAFALPAPPALAAGKAKHVVIVVMDGLRPDSVTAEDMPNLARLATAGTFFTRHHPVFISSTEVNGTALATGARPNRSGLMANREYRPDLELLGAVDTQSEWAAWKGDQLSGGKWIRVETLPQIVRAAGGRTVVAGTKPVALLWDRSWEHRSADQPTVYGGDTIPAALKDSLVASFGPIPPARDNRFFANVAQDHWTTRTLIDKLWSPGLPALSVLWLSEPDYSQHGSGPGTKVAREGLKSSDACLGKVLAALDQAKLRDQTDVLVVSDHGFSTVAQGVDVFDDLTRKGGFDIGGLFAEKPEKGSILIVGFGGSVMFYVTDHDSDLTARLVKHLQGTVYAGAIFTRDGLEGTFKLSDAGIDTPGAPDVVMSMRWSAEKPDREGALPGALLADSKAFRPGVGTHSSLSRFDMNNTLIAAGPDFKAGFRNQAPSASHDVAPTVLNILGIATPKEGMDGRVLSEAFVVAREADVPAVETTVLTAKRQLEKKLWQQYLKISRVGNLTYLDEANAGAGPEGR